jgi:hypothetical protein
MFKFSENWSKSYKFKDRLKYIVFYHKYIVGNYILQNYVYDHYNYNYYYFYNVSHDFFVRTNCYKLRELKNVYLKTIYIGYFKMRKFFKRMNFSKNIINLNKKNKEFMFYNTKKLYIFLGYFVNSDLWLIYKKLFFIFIVYYIQNENFPYSDFFVWNFLINVFILVFYDNIIYPLNDYASDRVNEMLILLHKDKVIIQQRKVEINLYLKNLISKIVEIKKDKYYFSYLNYLVNCKKKNYETSINFRSYDFYKNLNVDKLNLKNFKLRSFIGWFCFDIPVNYKFWLFQKDFFMFPSWFYSYKSDNLSFFCYNSKILTPWEEVIAWQKELKKKLYSYSKLRKEQEKIFRIKELRKYDYFFNLRNCNKIFKMNFLKKKYKENKKLYKRFYFFKKNYLENIKRKEIIARNIGFTSFFYSILFISNFKNRFIYFKIYNSIIKKFFFNNLISDLFNIKLFRLNLFKKTINSIFFSFLCFIDFKKILLDTYLFYDFFSDFKDEWSEYEIMLNLNFFSFNFDDNYFFFRKLLIFDLLSYCLWVIMVGS